jgi:hypothetical protein
LHTPAPDPSDSEGVLLALETAKALEARGDMYEATRWLRRAATEAEMQGNDARVLEFAHAAADLTSTVRELPSARPVPAVQGSAPSDPSEPTIRRSDVAEFAGVQSASPEDTTAQPDSSLTTIPDEESSVPTMVPPRASPIKFRRPASGSSSPSMSIASQLSVSADQPLTERSMRIGATRVAIKKAARNEKSFSVERLDAGQRLPVGMMEAMLVFAEEIDDSPELEADEVGEGSNAKQETEPGKHV